MPTFSYTTRVPHPLRTVFGWHERPGAIVRLTPPSAARVTQEPSGGLHDGSLARLRILVPMTFARAGFEWTARHQGYRPDDSFEDVLVTGPLSAWHHRHGFRADGDATVIEDRIEFRLPSVARGPATALAERVARTQLERMFGYRADQLRADLDFHAAHAGRRLTVAVSGASGLVGTQLCALLGGGGHRVLRLTRSAQPGPGRLTWDPQRGEVDAGGLAAADAVIHLAGEPIAGRFTRAHKSAVRDSRVDSTALLARTLAELAADGRERTLLCASASGWYGPDRGDEVLSEDSAPGDGFLAGVCRAWEAAAEPARAAGLRVVHVRTGLVQSGGGGQLALQAPIFAAGLGGRLGTGRQWLPWIGVDDIAGLYAHLAMTPGLDGPVNACAPGIVPAGQYADTLAAVLHRPCLLPVPDLGPALLLGREGAREIALAGQRMSCARAEQSGYPFRHPQLADALRHTLAR